MFEAYALALSYKHGGNTNFRKNLLARALDEYGDYLRIPLGVCIFLM